VKVEVKVKAKVRVRVGVMLRVRIRVRVRVRVFKEDQSEGMRGPSPCFFFCSVSFICRTWFGGGE
jgi:hypothetical protein